MENKVCGKEAEVALGWTTSSPTSLVVDSLASWVDKEAAPEMGVEGEARTWSIHSSGLNILTSFSCILFYNKVSKYLTYTSESHWMTFTMGKQQNYNLARMYCVALAMDKEARRALYRNVRRVEGVACAS
ncbi:hypothetical protein AMECASPLE_032272 [Ameca splendens]|uniref:Uncharacterized protein n=1 Tax=Ameca splendens TaxID=208324 RepID=A0ABV1A3A5_9TELE